MANYHYIIAGLPNLILDYENKPFSYQDIRNQIADLCSTEDLRLIEWLEFSYGEDNLSSHIYVAATKSKNNFIKKYYEFDRNIRNIIVNYRTKSTETIPSKYMIGEILEDFEDRAKIESILNQKNIIDKERLLDKTRWDNANQITSFNYFDIDAVLCFLLKAKLVDRWSNLNKELGAKLFKELVNEVRGTFKGLNNEKNENK